MSIANFLSGTKILDKRESRYNGELTVIRDIAWGTYIKAGGLPQSGGLARKIWEKPLKQISNYQLPISNILILGLGGGGIIELLKKYWPDARITGVDIDQNIVELGKKYIKWDEEKVYIVIEDAQTFLDTKTKTSKSKYDLIIVDTYNGSTFPAKFTKLRFIQTLKVVMSKKGKVIINRLYGSVDRDQASKFGEMLETEFDSVERLYPVANIMFICSN